LRKRILIIATAVCVLATAAVAYAQINTYTAVFTFTSKQGGTAAAPAPIGFNENITATGTDGNRTAVLLNITTKVYGLKMDGKDFPTCTLAQISAAKNDTVCPAKAAVATGAITAVLGPPNDFSSTAPNVAACDPALDVWNDGPGQQTYFFLDNATHVCLGGALQTGSVGPWLVTSKEVGNYLVTDDNIPASVDYPLGTTGGIVGSLETEQLNFLHLTTKVKGKTVSALTSFACLKGQRPYTTTITSTLPTTGAMETDTVNGTAPCTAPKAAKKKKKK
jgi:hypothetical protein